MKPELGLRFFYGVSPPFLLMAASSSFTKLLNSFLELFRIENRFHIDKWKPRNYNG